MPVRENTNKIHKYQEMQKYSKTKKETMGCLKIQLKCAGRFDRVPMPVRESTLWAVWSRWGDDGHEDAEDDGHGGYYA